MGDPPDEKYLDSELSKSVIEYLAAHPEAMDTAEGIATWWTKGEGMWNVERTRRVLEQLSEQCVLEKIGSGEFAHYRLRKELASS